MKLLVPAVAVAVLLSFFGCATPPQRAVSATISFTGEYLPLALVDVPPRVLRQKPPVYPPHWRERGIEGSALISFIVDTEGIPSQVQCRKATDQTFADAAQNAVRQWRFTPARKNGKPVSCAMEIPMMFSIMDRSS